MVGNTLKWFVGLPVSAQKSGTSIKSAPESNLGRSCRTQDLLHGPLVMPKTKLLSSLAMSTTQPKNLTTKHAPTSSIHAAISR